MDAVADAAVDPDETLDRIDDLRRGQRLAEARALALPLVAAQPDHADALIAASRAEADQLLLLDEEDSDSRALSAWSALDYAERGVAAGEPDAASWAQLASSQGAVTHLMPMFDRADHAALVLDTVERALALDDREPTALATLATLRLRLATLPWIADLFAAGAPETSVDEAVDAARRAFDVRPSVEHRLLLGKALLAAGEDAAARAILVDASTGADEHPRDRDLRPSVADLLATLPPP